MLDHFIYLTLLNFARSYNKPGMPDFLRGQILDFAEQFIENNCSDFSVDTTSGRMRVAYSTEELPDDNFNPIDEGTLNAYLNNVDLLDLVN